MAPLARSRPSATLDALSRRRLLIVSGKGGVGRTTVSALVGLALARRGLRVLVATTGHDDRLAWLLGEKTLPDRPVELVERLSVQRLVPRVCVREYAALVLGSERLARTVFDHRVVWRALRAVPGLDDFAVLGKVWHEAVRARSHDVVVFDGPATGHLRLNLGVPAAILDAVPGGPLLAEADLIQRSLQDERLVAAVLVGLPERWPLTELSELGGALRGELGLSVAAVVINGTWPADPPELATLPDLSPFVASALGRVDTATGRGRSHAQQIEEWRTSPVAAACAAQAWIELSWRAAGLEDRASLVQALDELEAA